MSGVKGRVALVTGAGSCWRLTAAIPLRNIKLVYNLYKNLCSFKPYLYLYKIETLIIFNLILSIVYDTPRPSRHDNRARNVA